MESVDWYARAQAAVEVILARAPGRPDIGVILGSGLGAFADRLACAVALPYAELPHFPTSSVVGHAGRLVVGELGGARIAALQGRVHLYEGHDAAEAALGARVLCLLGARALCVTNAAGACNPELKPGDLMRITDHLNLTGKNPLTGPNDPRLGPRFPDLSRAYDPRLGELLEQSAARVGVPMRRGVYAMFPGPSYETPAEIRMARILGADAVGMSTVPEVIAAAHMGVPVAGISCITNLAAGLSPAPLTHDEVMETAERVREELVSLLSEFLPAAASAAPARAAW